MEYEVEFHIIDIQRVEGATKIYVDGELKFSPEGDFKLQLTHPETMFYSVDFDDNGYFDGTRISMEDGT